jgi:hypothetical protein
MVGKRLQLVAVFNCRFSGIQAHRVLCLPVRTFVLLSHGIVLVYLGKKILRNSIQNPVRFEIHSGPK